MYTKEFLLSDIIGDFTDSGSDSYILEMKSRTKIVAPDSKKKNNEPISHGGREA
jgi:hypothetical protein